MTDIVDLRIAKAAKEKREHARLVLDAWDKDERETKRAQKADAEAINQRNREKL